jgi:RpiR family transcriptional regulator, carbohydrate utilization regulator
VLHRIDIVSRIAERGSRLRPAEQKVAQAILGDLPGCAAASIHELARRAAVSEASVTRFARAIGCDDVRDLKVAIARASGVGDRYLRDSNPPSEDSATGGTPASRQIWRDVLQVLEINHALIDPKTMLAAAHDLARARMVYVFGMGGASTTLSNEARLRLFRLGVAASTYHDAVLQRMVAASMQAGDLVLAFSSTGNLPELVASCEIAKEYGARVIAVSALGSRLAAIADVLLPVRSMETDFIFKPSSARYAMLLVLDTLVTELALLQKPRSQETLRRVKYALDEYRGGSDREPLGD